MRKTGLVVIGMVLAIGWASADGLSPDALKEKQALCTTKGARREVRVGFWRDAR